MTDEQLFLHHMEEAQKAFNRLKGQYQELEKRANDKWLSTKTEAAEYLGICRATFYKKYIHRGLEWKKRGVKRSTLDNFSPQY